ncbi:hypothetical protein JSO62_06175 [Riemerella anatipestifer]|uniref:hypothetical protein n=1 Tax=Riemerella anatipestifer TaxID=34085 RepID=UPI0030BDD34A
MSSLGAGMSTMGSLIEVGVEVITNDYSNKATYNTVRNEIISAMVSETVDAVLPGPTPSIKIQQNKHWMKCKKLIRRLLKKQEQELYKIVNYDG